MDSYITHSEKTYTVFYSPENEGGSSPDNPRKEVNKKIRVSTRGTHVALMEDVVEASRHSNRLVGQSYELGEDFVPRDLEGNILGPRRF
jgi:hypothetical protein